LRDHHKVWISCATLRRLYGRAAREANPEDATPVNATPDDAVPERAI
jgi:hypothetical protein